MCIFLSFISLSPFPFPFLLLFFFFLFSWYKLHVMSKIQQSARGEYWNFHMVDLNKGSSLFRMLFFLFFFFFFSLLFLFSFFSFSPPSLLTPLPTATVPLSSPTTPTPKPSQASEKKLPVKAPFWRELRMKESLMLGLNLIK